MATKKAIQDLYQMKSEGKKVTWLTAYDFPTAQFAQKAGLDMLLVGDSLAAIALQFNSTVEDILEQNEDLEDANAIFAGQILIIRINLVTPVPTEEGAAGEAEETPASDPGTIATLTPAP